jgi:hypothetical protein
MTSDDAATTFNDAVEHLDAAVGQDREDVDDVEVIDQVVSELDQRAEKEDVSGHFSADPCR